jgi:hypothetical protein
MLHLDGNGNRDLPDTRAEGAFSEQFMIWSEVLVSPGMGNSSQTNAQLIGG